MPKSSAELLTETRLESGVNVIKETSKLLPLTPGVYRMLNNQGEALYVGKARQLKKRVQSYTRVQILPIRLQRMIAETAKLEVILTNTETEALLLESNLIKQLAPPYNILLRDDKSFAYIKLSDHPFPLLFKHRGGIDHSGDYYGPFASTGAVNGTLEALYKIFKLRSCSDAEFKNRTRPCLQYHIQRCSAPCVKYISQEDYAKDVENVREFLGKKSHNLLDALGKEMQEASDRLDFEVAAKCRDKIRFLSTIQQQQGINIHGFQDADIMGMVQEGNQTCIQVFFFRNGCNYGSKPFFITHHGDETKGEVISAFIMQFYQEHGVPSLVLVNEAPHELKLIEGALGARSSKNVSILKPERGLRRKIIDQAILNSQEALKRMLMNQKNFLSHLKQIKDYFHLTEVPRRIEVYDNSHLFGKDAYGAMVVFLEDGFDKKSYRKFKISASEVDRGGDDFAMMREVIMRRMRKDEGGDVAHKPDLMIIDGGKGQLSAVQEALRELDVEIPVIAMSKGPDRNAGNEVFHQTGQVPLHLKKNDPVLYFLQRLRDEAHRYVITAHRKKRVANIEKSKIDDIPGVGAQRKKALLRHFGSSYNVSRAGLEDLVVVKGIDKNLAQTIYAFFHSKV
jgi:excinuclease ABC subunit C